MQGHELRLYEEGKVTVVVFFATWCPHCQVEIPRVVSFERALGAQPELGDRVRVVGVRTGVEKETEPFEDFVGRHDIRFPVWTDPVMSLAFSKFVRSQGLMGGIPLVAVIDDAGYAKYFLRSGDFRDTARELVWAVRDVLDHPQRDPVAAPDIVVGEAPQPGS